MLQSYPAGLENIHGSLTILITSVRFLCKGSDGHVTPYPLDWLKKINKICTNPEENTDQIFWDRDILESKLPSDIPFKEYMESDEGVVQFLQNLNKFGIAFLSGVPKTRAMTRVSIFRCRLHASI